MKTKLTWGMIKACPYTMLLILGVTLLIMSGCATVRNADVEAGEPAPVAQLAGKRVAILPVHGDDSIGTNSQLQLKQKLNKGINKKVTSLLPSAQIVSPTESIKFLNDTEQLSLIDSLFNSYKSMGFFDSKTVAKLAKTLNCDYIFIPALNNENLDAVLASVNTSALDIILISNKNDTLWTGSGDFKKGGIFGTGRTNASEVAKELVDLTFAYWQ